MTGHQPNPNTGKTAMGEVAEKIGLLMNIIVVILFFLLQYVT